MSPEDKLKVDIVPEGIEPSRWKEILDLESKNDLNLLALSEREFDVITTDRIYSKNPTNPSFARR